jgi:1A family penicillin-binding protein
LPKNLEKWYTNLNSKNVTQTFGWKFGMTVRDLVGATLFVCFVVVLVTSAVSIRIYRYYDVSNKDLLINRQSTGIELRDRYGDLLYVFHRAYPVVFTPLADIPKHLQQAVVTVEDKGFYKHWGFSPRGILRSAYLNLHQDRVVYGGSTITQQIVKNTLLTRQKSYTRKFREVVLALKLEQRYTKDELLEIYLNSAYFGEGAFGVHAAAKAYFGKDVSELTLAESSTLASVLPAPAALSPLTLPVDASTARRQSVLRRMQAASYINTEEYETAHAQTVTFNPPPSDINPSVTHFALMVHEALQEQLGVTEKDLVRRNLVVTTTLDRAWQEEAEAVVQQHRSFLTSSGATNTAIVITDPASGEVRALIGSADWHEPRFGMINMAVHPRQTGSAFKPVVYAAALESGRITPSTILHDQPTTFANNYKPQNYDNRFRGPVTVRQALANSLNVPAVAVTSTLGPAAVVGVAQRLGISSLSDNARYNLSIALGSEAISPLELTAAYATFASGGVYHKPQLILEVNDRHTGQTEQPEVAPQQVLDPRVAFIISSMLADEKARARTFGASLTVPFPAAVKTGTTQDYRDAWTVGYTPAAAIGVWVGNADTRPMNRLAGSRGAAPLWRDLMQRIHLEHPPAFAQPYGVVTARICPGQGLLVPPKSRSGVEEFFLAGTEPTRYCRLLPSPVPSVSPPPDAIVALLPKEKKEKKERTD